MGDYARINELIHDSLRRDLERLRHTASEPVPGRERREAVARRVDWLVDFLHLHHAGEDEAIWPRALRKQPGLASLAQEMDAEHEALESAASRLRQAAAVYAAEGSPASRSTLAGAVDEVRAACLPHLEHEERVAVPQLVEVLDKADWVAVDKYYRKGVRLRQLGSITAWLLDDIDPRQVPPLRAELTRPLMAFLGWRYGDAYAREAELAWGREPTHRLEPH